MASLVEALGGSHDHVLEDYGPRDRDGTTHPHSAGNATRARLLTRNRQAPCRNRGVLGEHDGTRSLSCRPNTNPTTNGTTSTNCNAASNTDPNPAVVGDWWYDSWTDSLTRQQFAVAGLWAGYRTGYGYHTPELLSRCQVGQRLWDVFVIWDEPIDHPEPLVVYRFGNNTGTLERWFVGEKNNSTFLPDWLIDDFLYWLQRYGVASPARLSINVGLGHPNASITAFWNISGGNYVVQNLTEYCGR